MIRRCDRRLPVGNRLSILSHHNLWDLRTAWVIDEVEYLRCRIAVATVRAPALAIEASKPIRRLLSLRTRIRPNLSVSLQDIRGNLV